MDALLRGLKVRLPLQNVKFALVGPFIWHHDVASDQPRRGLAPGADNCLMNARRCENRAPLHSTSGRENNDCTVMPLPRRKMNGMFAPRPQSVRRDMLLHVLLRE